MGLEVQSQVLALGYRPIVIFMTAFPERVTERAVEAGAVAVLAKPVEESSLVDAIEKCK
jgi:FixJ family two-component response regulator